MNDPSRPETWPQRLVDVGIGIGGIGATRVLAPTARLAARLVEPPTRFVLRSRLGAGLEARGRVIRTRTRLGSTRWIEETLDRVVPTALTLARRHVDPALVDRELDALVPWTVEAVLSRLEPVSLIEAHLRPEQIEKLIDMYLVGVVDQVFRRLDVTTLVRDRVDLVLLTQHVLERIDLAAIADDVIDEIDLPSIIRESTTGVASDVVSGTRASAANADEVVAGFFRRMRGASTSQEPPTDA